jgi:hypothetical protein
VRHNYDVVPTAVLSAESHDRAALRVKFDDHVGPLVHCPDVVLRVDTDRMSHLESVQPFSNLTQIVAILVKFEQPRSAAAGEHEEVALRV